VKGERESLHLTRQNGLDHVVVLMFENRSFDHLLGRLYEPGEVESFVGSSARTWATRSRSGPSTEPTRCH
jgi:phospholipase C